MARKISRRCNKPHPNPIRISREFKDLINFIKAKHLLMNKKPPSDSKITQIIANKINKEELLQNDFIRF